MLGRGYSWLDTGTHESFIEASNFIQTIEKQQGHKVACIEEIAFLKGFISKGELTVMAQSMINTDYGKYLMELAEMDS